MDIVTSIIVGIGSLCLVSLIYNGIKERRSKPQVKKSEIDMEDNDHKNTVQSQEQPPKPESFLTALAIIKGVVSEMGCHPVVDERGWLQFTYQGQIYNLDCNGNTATIWKPSWACIE